MFVICAVLVYHVSSQPNGEFIIVGHTRLLYVYLWLYYEKKVTLVHVYITVRSKIFVGFDFNEKLQTGIFMFLYFTN